MNYLKTKFYLHLLVFSLFLFPLQVLAIDVKVDHQVFSKDGSFSLSWDKILKNEEYEVILYADEYLTEIMSTTKINTNHLFLSGYKNGVYFFRVNALGVYPVKSKLILVEVNHYSHQFAIGLFIIGGLVIALMVVVLIYHTLIEKK